MNDRWRRVESLCHAALARPAAERADFIAAACGDDAALRSEVDSLVAQAASSPSFLEIPMTAADSSPSLVGRQLGAYRLEAPIGAGGMGEVYRAKDTRLGRDVALKVLPAAFADDAQRRARFEREARAVAALNHPNICTIHDVGHDQGIDFLVMELVDGESLAARLARGPLPLDEALARAMEIADALDKAHQHGIIHRDLKPGNVMLARTGSGKSRATHAKLLDFGLARIVPSGVAAGAAPTDTTPMTETGAVLGTVQYMAPEQIEGQPADARTDIFAFAALLYEMVTGRRAFEGSSAAAVIAAILREDPPPVESCTRTTPRALGRLMRNCLAKNPDDRYASMHDVLLELRGIAEDDLSADTMPSPRRRWQRETVAWVLAAMALAAAGVLLLRWPGPSRGPTLLPRMRTTILQPSGRPLTPILGIALSPDGTKLVFSAGETLWLRSLDELAARELPGTDQAMYPFWSPDSRAIGFFAGDRLFRMRPEDASPTFVCEALSPRGGSWGANDVILFGSRNTLRKVPAGGGPVTEVSRLEPQHLAHKWPFFLPDGQRFLYAGHLREWKSAPLEIFLGSLDGTPTRRLGESWSGAVYATPGFVLSVGVPGLTLVARRLDLAGERLVGEAIPISAGLAVTSQRWTAPFSASSTGSLAYVTGSDQPLSRLVWIDGAGRELEAASPARYSELALSPDGRHVVAGIADDDRATYDLWEVDLERGTRTRLTDTPDDEQLPIWTRTQNGEEMFYSARRRGSVVDLYRRRPGSGSEERLVRNLPGEGSACDVSPDGKWLLYLERRFDEEVANLWLLPLAGGEPRPFQVDRYHKQCGRISPDGRWVLYASTESGQVEVYVRQFPSGRPYQVSKGRSPRWGPQGKEIYYFDVDSERVLSVTFAAGGVPTVGRPNALFEHGGDPSGFGVAPGPRFLRMLPDPATPPASLTFLSRWLPDTLR